MKIEKVLSHGGGVQTTSDEYELVNLKVGETINKDEAISVSIHGTRGKVSDLLKYLKEGREVWEMRIIRIGATVFHFEECLWIKKESRQRTVEYRKFPEIIKEELKTESGEILSNKEFTPCTFCSRIRRKASHEGVDTKLIEDLMISLHRGLYT